MRNCSLRALSPFPTLFSTGLYSRHVKNQGLCGKGLIHMYFDSSIKQAYLVSSYLEFHFGEPIYVGLVEILPQNYAQDGSSSGLSTLS